MQLPAREAYRRWAATYDDETVVSFLDEIAARTLTPPLSGRALLDVGCGTARRLSGADNAQPRRAVGVDLVAEMLQARRHRGTGAQLACADLRALPLAARTFDVIWCRLVLGHLATLDAAYAELARVARPGASVLVTDFHAAAVAEGHVRAFRDAAGVRVEVEHHVHDVERHVAVAAAHDLMLATRRDCVVGPEVRWIYERAGMGARFADHAGLPLVLALVFQR